MLDFAILYVISYPDAGFDTRYSYTYSKAAPTSTFRSLRRGWRDASGRCRVRANGADIPDDLAARHADEAKIFAASD